MYLEILFFVLSVGFVAESITIFFLDKDFNFKLLLIINASICAVSFMFLGILKRRVDKLNFYIKSNNSLIVTPSFTLRY